jgi:multicomponent Na+:H+ antiporter subunit B
MRVAGLLLIALLGVVLVWGAQDLPGRGDPDSPAATHPSVSVYYIENAYSDSRTPNMVTAVLADYRGFDTFGEAVVVVTAAVSCLLILLRRTQGGSSSNVPGAPGGTAAKMRSVIAREPDRDPEADA